MIIDFHVHCFPDFLAPRAVASLRETASKFGYDPRTDGTVSSTVSSLRSAGIGAAHALNIATNSKQQGNVNSFAARQRELSDGFLYPAGSVHPDCDDPESALDALLEAGIRGIKVHPDYVGVMIDDPRFDRIFSACEERGMYVVTHAGFDPVSPDRIHCTPEGLARVMTAHPDLTLVAAHMGGIGQIDGVFDMLVGSKIFLDTSLSSIRPDERERLYEILHLHDDGRILFGTDTPWSDPREEISFLKESGLSERALDNIFYKNAARLPRPDTEDV